MTGTIILYDGEYIGLLNEIDKNIFTIIHSNGTASGQLNISEIEYKVVSTHESIVQMLIAMADLVDVPIV